MRTPEEIADEVVDDMPLTDIERKRFIAAIQYARESGLGFAPVLLISYRLYDDHEEAIFYTTSDGGVFETEEDAACYPKS